MKVIANSKELREGIGKAVKQYIIEEKKEGIHLSELYLPLKTYFYKLYPEVGLTENEIYYFILGRGYHSIVEAIVKYLQVEDLKYLTSEKELVYQDGTYKGRGVIYTPDILYKDREGRYIPLEVKTTRKSGISKSEEIPESYAFQTVGYIALANAHQIDKYSEFYGYLYAINVIRPEYGLHRFTLSSEEMRDVLSDIRERYNLLVDAIVNRNPDILLSKYGRIPEWAGKEMLKAFKGSGIDISKYVEGG